MPASDTPRPTGRNAPPAPTASAVTMVWCPVCSDWLHPACLGIPVEAAVALGNQFVCPNCVADDPQLLTAAVEMLRPPMHIPGLLGAHLMGLEASPLAAPAVGAGAVGGGAEGAGAPLWAAAPAEAATPLPVPLAVA